MQYACGYRREENALADSSGVECGGNSNGNKETALRRCKRTGRVSFELKSAVHTDEVAAFGKLDFPHFDIRRETAGGHVPTTGGHGPVSVDHLDGKGRKCVCDGGFRLMSTFFSS